MKEKLCGGVIVKRLVTFLMFALLPLSLASVAAAPEPKPIPNWANLRQDMELFKGALDRTIGGTVLNTYRPGYGVVFLVAVRFGTPLHDVQREIERALQFITPTISSLPEGERIAIAAYAEDFLSEWELMYISRADSSSDPDTWDVYYNTKYLL